MNKKITLNESKLARFSAVAGAIIASGGVNSQIIYTDVNPDVVIDTISGPYNLDFNSDATPDLVLAVMAFAGAGSTSGFTFTYVGTAAGAQAGVGGGIVGTVTGTASTFSPAVMSSGNLINAAAQFGSNGALALEGVATIPALAMTYPFQQGNWIGISDKYLGCKFMIGANTHYGWVRLDVSAGSDTIRVKDYAFNQNFDLPLNAGQIAGLENIAVNQKATIKTTLNEAIINVTPDLIGGRIIMVNMAGQEVKAVTITDINTTIHFEGFETGIYTIAAQFDGGSINKRVYVK